MSKQFILSMVFCFVFLGSGYFNDANAYSRGCESELSAVLDGEQNFLSTFSEYSANCPDGPLSNPYCTSLWDELLFAEFDLMMAEFELEICLNFIY